MDGGVMGETWVQVIVGACVLINIICIVLFFGKKGETSDVDEIKTDMMLMNRNFFSLKREVEELIDDVHTMGHLMQNDSDGNSDELSRYLKKGLTHQDIAKKMNRSVKEIDLMVKLRGKK